MFRICKNSLSACSCRHFSSRPQPSAHAARRLHTCGYACDAGRCHTRKKGSTGSVYVTGTFYSSGHYRERLEEQVSSVLCKVCTFEPVARLVSP